MLSPGGLDPTSVLQECRYLSERAFSVDEQKELLAKLLCVLNTKGPEIVPQKQATEIFFALTKILHGGNTVLHSATVQAISLLCCRTDAGYFATRSLTKLYESSRPMQPACLRLLGTVCNSSALADVSKLATTAVSDFKNERLVASAGAAVNGRGLRSLSVSLAPQAASSLPKVSGPAGALLVRILAKESIAKAASASTAKNPYARLQLIKEAIQVARASPEGRATGQWSQRGVIQFLLEFLPSVSEATKTVSKPPAGGSLTGSSTATAMVQLEALKWLLDYNVSPFTFSAVRPHAEQVLAAAAAFLVSSPSTVGRTALLVHLVPFIDAARENRFAAPQILFGALEACSTDSNQQLSAYALICLVRFGHPNARVFVGKLASYVPSFTKKVDEGLQQACVTTAVEYCRTNPGLARAVVPALAQLLASPSRSLMLLGYGALAKLAPVDEEALRLLLEHFEDCRDESVNRDICELLTRLGRSGSNSLMAAGARASGAAVQAGSATGLKAAGARELNIICSLWSRSQLEEPSVRIAALGALRSIGDKATVLGAASPANSSQAGVGRLVSSVLKSVALSSSDDDPYIAELCSLQGADEIVPYDIDSILNNSEAILRGDTSCVDFFDSPLDSLWGGDTIETASLGRLSSPGSRGVTPGRDLFASPQGPRRPAPAQKPSAQIQTRPSGALDALALSQHFCETNPLVRETLDIVAENGLIPGLSSWKGSTSVRLFTNGKLDRVSQESADLDVQLLKLVVSVKGRAHAILAYKVSASEDDFLIQNAFIKYRKNPHVKTTNVVDEVGGSKNALLIATFPVEVTAAESSKGTAMCDTMAQISLRQDLCFLVDGAKESIKLSDVVFEAFDFVTAVQPGKEDAVLDEVLGWEAIERHFGEAARQLREPSEISPDLKSSGVHSLTSVFDLGEIKTVGESLERLPEFLGLSVSGLVEDSQRRASVYLGGISCVSGERSRSGEPEADGGAELLTPYVVIAHCVVSKTKEGVSVSIDLRSRSQAAVDLVMGMLG